MERSLPQQLSNLLRDGVITEVDSERALCRVRSGETHSDFIPWLTPAAGHLRVWAAPSPGEQVLLLCRDGDLGNALILRGLFSDQFTAPASSPDLVLVEFPDKAVISYSSATHALDARLPSGGSITLIADGGVSITGPVTITGDVNIQGTATASEDVVGGGISLKDHTHGAVQPGSGNSGPPA